MKNLTATICLAVAVLLGSAGVSWSQDFQKGVTAYESGDYATALREWTPLAEQGNADAQYKAGVAQARPKRCPFTAMVRMSNTLLCHATVMDFTKAHTLHFHDGA